MRTYSRLAFLLPMLLVFLLQSSVASEVYSPNWLGNPTGEDTLQAQALIIAGEYLSALNLTPWSMELQPWVTTHSYKAAVDTFQQEDWTRWEFEKYSFKTRLEHNQCTAEYSFFVNDDYTAPKVRLEQVVIYDRRTKRNGQLDERVWKAIADSLTSLYGSAGKVPKDDEMLLPFSLGPDLHGRPPLFWEDTLKRIVLAEDYEWFQPGVRTDLFKLLARTKGLDARTTRAQDLEGTYDRSNPLPQGGLLAEVCDSLRGINTPFAGLCQQLPMQKVELDDLLRCGAFVKETESSSDSSRLPLYRMALYAFGELFTPEGSADAPDTTGAVDTLRHYNILIEGDHLGQTWRQNRQPLVETYSRYASTRWGQLAFVMVQQAGWCMDDECNGNFGPQVISKGEEFLNRFPQSTFASAVLLTIAKGYETNWNVSTCSVDHSDYMYDENYRNDVASWAKAIATYERILSLYPTSPEAEIAKLRLPRLRLKLNTDTRDFFFIYD
jgi:hypothetical protein